MKCPIEAIRDGNMEKSSDATESKVFHLKASPVKEPVPINLQNPSTVVTTVLFSGKDNTSAVHNKENTTSRDHDRTLDECFEDSGYLSLHNSHINVEEENDHTLGKCTAVPLSAVMLKEISILSNKSPSKCQERTKTTPGHPVCLALSTPVDRFKTKATALSSTPTKQHGDPNLPILKFQQAVCEELAKSYKKNKKYDWSIIPEIAKEHLLDRVIGGQMGLEHVDIFMSLLSRNMKTILTNILALLGDLDLIRCKKVSKTWKRIICEDKAASSRCQQAEQVLRETRSSSRHLSLTRDVATSRVVLSCMQRLGSSCTSSSSSSSSDQSRRINKVTATSQKNSTPISRPSRYNEYVQAASSLKQHQSLRSCRKCGSPATHLAEVQRAKCTRSSCSFDFCTRCQEPFHGSYPCRTVQSETHFHSSKMNTIVPGSTRSKRSIRRL